MHAEHVRAGREGCNTNHRYGNCTHGDHGDHGDHRNQCVNGDQGLSSPEARIQRLHRYNYENNNEDQGKYMCTISHTTGVLRSASQINRKISALIQP